MSNKKWLIISIFCIMMQNTYAQQYTDSITQYGITWYFDAQYEYGQFANGDYWVIGPVAIAGIDPLSTDISGRVMHGSMVNPSPTDGTQGYDNAMSYNAYASSYNAALDVSSQNPLVLNPNSSLVSTISVNVAGARPQIKTAAVLTVLDSVPLNNGATVFRPPYSGSDKTHYFVDDLNTTLLPSLIPTSSAPSLTTVKNYFQRVQLDHKMGWSGRYQHPADNMPDYGSDIASRTAVGALRLMLNDSIDDKMPALINYIQMGIDFYGILKAGGKWSANGGHMEGRKLPITFAAVLLDNQEMKDAVSNADMNTFGENKGIRYSQKADDGKGIPLFAQIDCSESMYWKKLNDNSASGSKTCKDPYGYIDGGQIPGKSYLGCCLSQPWKATSIAVRIMPELRSVWNYDYFHDFSDRYADFGIWTQPDPCAPTDGDWNNYGITYGPDPNNPGECIYDTDPSDGIGRTPNTHGDNKDWGYYGSGFANEMWDTYRDTSTVGIQPQQNINEQPKLTVFPNPNKGVFYLSVPSKQAYPISIDIISIQGQLMYHKKLNNEMVVDYSHPIDMSWAAKGLYFAIIQTKDNIIHKKIVCQ